MKGRAKLKPYCSVRPSSVVFNSPRKWCIIRGWKLLGKKVYQKKKKQPRCKMLQIRTSHWFNSDSAISQLQSLHPGEMSNAKRWQLLLTPSFFIISFSCHDPADHQPIHSVQLSPQAMTETKPLCSHNSNYYIRSPGLSVFEGCFCVCLRNYGCLVCKEGEKTHYLG